MLQQLRIATLLLIGITVFTGGVYPAVITILAQTLFPHQANGSLIRVGTEIVGSELIGQSFTQPEYFWGRLSATAPVPYNSASSSGSNYGPLNPALKEIIEGRIKALREGGIPDAKFPVDLVTASGSGLDPHISPAAAEFQVKRVAASRGITEAQVLDLVRKQTELRQLAVLGEPRVNVLLLNRALDTIHGMPGHEKAQ